MPVLQPFRALYSPEASLFIPGEDAPPAFPPASLRQDPTPALFLYHQHFAGTVRVGVMGLLDRTAAQIYPHEKTEPARVAACRAAQVESSSIFLWCSYAKLLQPTAPPHFDVTDRFHCRHQIWRIASPQHIAQVQNALAHKDLFLADGHHRFAAGWQVATIQIRTPALSSLPAHRLVLEPLDIPNTQEIPDLQAFWAATPANAARFGVILRNEPIRGFELPRARGERNATILHGLALQNARTQPIRSISAAVEAVQSGEAHMAFLLESLPVDDIEADAQRGILLPPKSTDFFPKLAGGLVMHWHQKETFIPPIT